MDEDLTYLGDRYDGWLGRRVFGVSQAVRRRHIWLIGRSGSGKTTLLHNMIIQDIEADRGFCFIDPHGDAARALLDEIPGRRYAEDRVLIFDPSDRSYPVGLNLLWGVERDDRPLIAANIVSIFRHIWADSWGPRTEYLLQNALRALLDCPAHLCPTLMELPRLLSQASYRTRVIGYIEDAKVRSFWVDEFERWDDRFRAEAVAPLQNKAGALLTNPALRNCFGQFRQRFSLERALDEGWIIIARLPKGELGEAETSLLGSMLTTAIYMAALRRSRHQEQDRQEFALYLDEFQNFRSSIFEHMLSESRKYRLSLVLSHQYLAQLTDEIRDAVLGNVATTITFRTSAQDWPLLARELAALPERALRELSNFEVAAKIAAGAPFLGKTLPPLRLRYGRGQQVLAKSRRAFSVDRAGFEKKIERWLARLMH